MTALRASYGIVGELLESSPDRFQIAVQPWWVSGSAMIAPHANRSRRH